MTATTASAHTYYYGDEATQFTYYYNKFGQESRAASPAFLPSRA